MSEIATETVVATGFAFPEGPCVDADGVLHVVELANRCVSRVADGVRTVVAEPGGSPNGAALGPDGKIWFCNGGGNWPATASTAGRPGLGGEPGLLQRVDASGVVETVLERVDGRPLHSPNDLCFDAHGGMYFSDPVWPGRRADGSSDGSPGRPGDVGYLAADGTSRIVASGLLFPNGLQVTPDGRALVVGETVTGRIHRYEIIAPGHLSAGELYAELGADAGPDGMCFDACGRLLVGGSGSGAIFVVAPDGGHVGHTVRMQDAEVTNLCFGGDGHRELFVTEATLGQVVRLAWPVAGAPLAPERAHGLA